jgi:hypothetical protein
MDHRLFDSSSRQSSAVSCLPWKDRMLHICSCAEQIRLTAVLEPISANGCSGNFVRLPTAMAARAAVASPWRVVSKPVSHGVGCA